MRETFQKLLYDECGKLGILLAESQIDKFYHFYGLLIAWNQKMNLTAITEWDEVVIKHFIDSLAIVKAFQDFGYEKSTLIDVGTGAGFPGIPLKIVFEKIEIVLLDSSKKRVRFLSHVINELKLTEIYAIHGRSEEFGQNERHREKYDFCVSRAVANISTLSEYCLPFVKIGGSFISYKSGLIEEELSAGKNAILILGGKIKEKILFQLTEQGLSRSLIVIEKIGSTNSRYPRKAGIPSREPIR